MNFIEIIGFIAGFLVVAAALPQLIKSLKTKTTKDISLMMYLTICLGLLLWLVYGILISSPSLIFTNILSFATNFSVLVLKLKYK